MKLSLKCDDVVEAKTKQITRETCRMRREMSVNET